MRVFLVVFLVVIYMSALLKPLFPYIDYAINKEYIANVLCVNKDKPKMNCCGKCYLKKQLKKAAKEDTNSPQNTPAKTDKTDNVSIHLMKMIHYTFAAAEEKYNFSVLKQNILQIIHKPITPPPKRSFS